MWEYQLIELLKYVVNQDVGKPKSGKRLNQLDA